MRGVVGAGVNTTGLRQIGTQIARGGFLFYYCSGAAGVIGIFVHHLKGMQIDVSVWAIARAETAADAPIFNDDFQRIAATNGAYWAAHHAERITALAATGGNQILLKAQAIANEPRDTIVSVRAGVDASVATRAFL